MDEQMTALDELHARCDALEALLGTLKTAFIDRPPKKAALLKKLFRKSAEEARHADSPYIQVELLERWSEWIEQEERAALTGKKP